MKKVFAVLLFVALVSSSAFAAEGETVKLPDPEKSGGIPVIEAIAQRQSAGDFVDTELTLQEMSNLLWAAGGINRDNGKLTFATAMNTQDMVIFAFTKSGVFRYNPDGHSITKVADGDYRVLTGGQPFVAKAAVDLLYIQDTEKWPKGRPIPASDILNCGFAHAGLSMQNVYLFAASKGWGARTRMNFDREKLTELLGLTEKHNFTLMQCVGPKP
ncbi:MAG: nitroreductase family protein [Synergistaceae bacterium]|nr:nitroreductase family protein [Synergistaceae bacterium]MBQ3398533.1 nitroreductase family protein [Synergistaceae bacterium]MBQ3759249.1 nitroreductase family protein [Synergistaceae bacterium]MBQ4402161.1 nitroreductase family protein [Synergistaceae bacterium]MBQ6114630.1 nitroreductase family protein [Synergistaceae bacterium]